MHDVAVLLLCLRADVVLELFLPVLSGLPIEKLVTFKRIRFHAEDCA